MIVRTTIGSLVAAGLLAVGILLIALIAADGTDFRDIAHARSSPSIVLRLSPSHSVPMDTEITATVVLDNLDIESYSSVVLRADITGYGSAEGRCNGDDTGQDIDVAVDQAREELTISVFDACPREYHSYGSYTLDASISVLDATAPGGKAELASTSTRFSMSRYLTIGVPTSTPPSPGAKAWMEPDPTTFDMYVGEWRQFRFRTNILVYLNDHLGVQAFGDSSGHFAALVGASPDVPAEELCEDPNFSHVNWRRAINQPLWIVACQSGNGVIVLQHETDAVDPLYRYEVRTLAKGGNASPEFAERTGAPRQVAEEEAKATNVGSPVEATDAENDPLTYSLGGADAGSFTIGASSGQLTTTDRLDYEVKSGYSVTVSVHDGRDADGNVDATVDQTIAVVITVTNVDEAGTVTLSASQPQVGDVITASLDDPDLGVSGEAWRWERSSDQTNWNDTDGAASDSYTPVTTDLGYYLRATASYADGHGSGKSAEAVSSYPVGDTSSPQPLPPSQQGSASTFSAPTNVAATSWHGTITVTWAPGEMAASQVIVVVNALDDTDYCLGFDPSGNASSYQCSGRARGATYVVLVIALDGQGGYEIGRNALGRLVVIIQSH